MIRFVLLLTLKATLKLISKHFTKNLTKTEVAEIQKLVGNLESIPFGGVMTPQQVLLEALQDSDDMEFLVISGRNKDGSIALRWSSAGYLDKLGVLSHCAGVIQSMRR